MGDKKKHRDRERSEEKDPKKSRKKAKDGKRDKERKKKSDRRDRSSSSSESSSSSSERSRSRDKKSKKKKSKEEKEDKPTIILPFSLVVPPTIPAPIAPIRPIGGIVMPPPAPNANSTTATTKLKAKQPHIFKLLPRLPLGPVTIGRTIYSSQFLTKQFEKKMLNSLCEQLQKSAKSEGYKKMANNISKVRTQINGIDTGNVMKQQKKQESVNQFEVLKQSYLSEISRLKNQYVNIIQKS